MVWQAMDRTTLGAVRHQTLLQQCPENTKLYIKIVRCKNQDRNNNKKTHTHGTKRYIEVKKVPMKSIFKIN